MIRDGAFALEHVKRMNHLDQAGFNIGAALTCVLPMAHTVYIGDEDGRVVSYLFACIIFFERDADLIQSTNGIAFNGMADVDGNV